MTIIWELFKNISYMKLLKFIYLLLLVRDVAACLQLITYAYASVIYMDYVLMHSW